MADPRQPVSFRERVLFQFRTPANQHHLEDAFRRTLPAGDPRLAFVLTTLPRTIDAFGATTGQGGALLDTDPLATRGSSFRGANLVEELQHLNRAFYHQRLREASHNLSGGRGASDERSTTRAGASDEPLFYQMFVHDSLRPPGLENLNSTGPLHDLHEDQSFNTLFRTPDAVGFEDNYNPSVGIEDMPWSAGTGHRTAEAAVAEYYGEDSPIASKLGLESPHAAGAHGGSAGGAPFYADTHISDLRPGGGRDAFTASRERMSGLTQMDASRQVYGAPGMPGGAPRAGPRQSVSGFENWFYSRRSGSSMFGSPAADAASLVSGAAGRFERREAIPHWQRGGRRTELVTGRWQSADDFDGGGDVEETLGSGSAEFGGERLGHVRRWDTSRLLAGPRASHRIFGATSESR